MLKKKYKLSQVTCEKFFKRLKGAVCAIKDIPRNITEFGLSTAIVRWRRVVGIISVNEYVEYMSYYMSNLLTPITEKYKKGHGYLEEKRKIDFNSKYPVWVCWFQGEDKMPPLCQACVNQIKENLPEEAQLVFLTYENYLTYIDIPEEIVRKHNSGIICPTNYSDIVRYGLLATYGGVWLDAAIYVSQNAIGDAIKYELLTPRFYREGHKLEDASRGRWIGGCWFSRHENILFKYVYESLIYFWKQHNFALEYLACDYIIWNGYMNIPEITKLLDKIPVNNEKIRLLNESLEMPYSEKMYKSIMKETGVHLINRHRDYSLKTESGEYTIYGYILKINNVNIGDAK